MSPIPSPSSDVSISELKAVMGSFASGVTIVAAMEGETPVGFTCQSFVSLSLDPPLVAMAPARTSTSWPRIRTAGSFCVNILEESQGELGIRFATSGADRFAGLEWSPSGSGAPILAGALGWVDCSVELIHDAGDHELVVGRVLAVGSRAGYPLLFYRSRFEHLKR